MGEKKNALMQVKTTTKKVKYQGIQEYINKDTGEVVEMHVTDIEERDFNFSKVWMRNFVSTLELVGNKKTALCYWLIDQLDRENKISMNYRQMSEQTGYSYKTVAVTMSILQDADFLRKVGTAYMVNPDILFKGTKNARMLVLQDYHQAPKKVLTSEQKIKQLEDAIEELTSELAEVKRQADMEKNIIDAEIDPQYAFTITEGEIHVIEKARPVEHQQHTKKGKRKCRKKKA